MAKFTLCNQSTKDEINWLIYDFLASDRAIQVVFLVFCLDGIWKLFIIIAIELFLSLDAKVSLLIFGFFHYNTINMNFNELLTKYRNAAHSKTQLGNTFERVVRRYLEIDFYYQTIFEKIWLWNAFPGRQSISKKDIGIDLVALTKSGEYWAIQAKCYYKDNQINKKDVDTFLATSGMDFKIGDTTKKFAKRLFVSTTNKWSVHAEAVIRNQHPPLIRISLSDLENADVDWLAIDEGTKVVRKQKKLRPYQQQAIDKAIAHYQTEDRGKLIMACGTGKTLTALRLAEKLTNNQGFILVMVPSIALVGQLMKEWYSDSEKPINGIAVCSDPSAGKISDDELRISLTDLPVDATTDPEKVIRELEADKNANGLKVIFSTYHSIEVINKIQKYFQKKNPKYSKFDLIICDEAHRTVGYEHLAAEKRSYFVRVHDNEYIQSKKRLYMTATPKLFSENAKQQAKKTQQIVWSMDDKEHFGSEIFHVSFGEAVARGDLADYKVIILTISEKDIPKKVLKNMKELQEKLNQEELEKNPNLKRTKNNVYRVDEIIKLAGVYNAVSKNFLLGKDLVGVKNDPGPMLRAVAYCSNIKFSKLTSNNFDELSEQFEKMGFGDKKKLQWIDADHIDGSMRASLRDEKLSWLKRDDFKDNETRLITNVRCLSEGVDVPSLDAVIFLSKRNSQIDIVQSVGRVMRKSPNKKYGYIIVPVVIGNDADPNSALDNSEDFKTVWAVLNALRAHDDRLENVIEKLRINKTWPDNILTARTSGSQRTIGMEDVGNTINDESLIHFKSLQKIIYGKIVDRVGNRKYWEDWAGEVAKIAKEQIEKIHTLISTNEVSKSVFEDFLKALQSNINPSLTKDEAVEMLAQHTLTKPIFEALFEGYDFASSNPISIAMENVLVDLETKSGIVYTKGLQNFYEAVAKRIKGIDSAEGRQKIITELYEKFFKTAFPKMIEQLGIVYTPIEIVDFIINSVNDISKQEFGKSLNDKKVHILDPFTGTGTFISRLLQSGLIEKKNLVEKYKNEIWANEIVPLAYYIAAVNIENIYHDLVGGKYVPFKGICLTDTFQLGEEKVKFSSLLPKNSERVMKQTEVPITIIIGNPPYSAGQKSENDNAKNMSYDILDNRLKNTYVKNSPKGNKNSLYDSYYKAFRWSTDRLGGDDGIICFVSNGGWLESTSGAGFRKTIAQEFSSIYVLNLRGNARTQGKARVKEGGTIFDAGSRAPIAIMLLVKNKKTLGDRPATIYYRDIGDYLKRDQKLSTIKQLKSFQSDHFNQKIKPNNHGDWINQRQGFPENFIMLSEPRNINSNSSTFFKLQSLGHKTNRDAWVYNSSKTTLEKNVKQIIKIYDSEKIRFFSSEEKPDNLDRFLFSDPTKIKWDGTLKNWLKKGKDVNFIDGFVGTGLYRPFYKTNLYFSKRLNNSVQKIPLFFPTSSADNLVISVQGKGDTKEFSCILTNHIPNLHLLPQSRTFPLYYYPNSVDKKQSQFKLITESKKIKNDAVSDFIFNKAKNLYTKPLTKKDIFYYVYGFLHSPEYKQTFANTLSKEDVKIPLLNNENHFWAFSKAGRKLADLHLNFETQPKPKEVAVEIKGENYKVIKMKLASKEDKTKIFYNNQITISNIPLEAYNYQVNGRSAIEWVIERQRIKIDKDSQIINDPNKWAEEHDDPKYILKLLLSVITVSIQSVKIINNLPKIDFTNNV